MVKLLLVTAASLAMLGAAIAADLPRREPLLKPVQVVPAKQVADEHELKLPRVYDHPQPVSVYDDMATCG